MITDVKCNFEKGAQAEHCTVVVLILQHTGHAGLESLASLDFSEGASRTTIDLA